MAPKAGTRLAFLLGLVHSLLHHAAAQSCPLSAPQITDAQLDSVCNDFGDSFSSPACTVYRLCTDATQSPAMSSRLCNTTRIASSLCLDDAAIVRAVDLPACTRFAAQRTTALTPACVQKLGIFSILSTDATRKAAGQGCQAAGDPTAMAGCLDCPSANADECPIPLVALGQGCADKPTMSQCSLTTAPIKTFCEVDAREAGNAGWGAAAICLLPDSWDKVKLPASPTTTTTTAPAPTPAPVPGPVTTVRPAPTPAPAPTTTAPSPITVTTTAPRPSPQTVGTTTTSSATLAQCLSNTATPSCASFVYPDSNIAADITILCQQMGDMAGCSLSNECKAGRVTDAKVCSPMTLLATLCVDMPTMRSGCGNYNVLCKAGSAITQCTTYPAVPGSPLWKDLRPAAIAACATVPGSTSCAKCTDEFTCDEPLPSLAGVCNSDQAAAAGTNCGVITKFCTAVNTAGINLTPFCPATASNTPTSNITPGPRAVPDTSTPSATPTPTTAPTTAPSTPTTTGVVDACVSDSTVATCAEYTYPDSSAAADINSLCSEMPDMPGCSISKACKDGKVDVKYCAPMTILATLCQDMPSMQGCANYKRLCKKGSQVKQCTTQTAIPGTPTWASSKAEIESICTEMGMEACSQCTKGSCPDPLATLTALCLDMPTMRQCAGVNSWCGATTGLDYYCKAGSGLPGASGLPSMLMYFHERLSEVVLWKEWVPTTRGHYAATIIAILVFGVVSMGIKAYVAVLSTDWRHASAQTALMSYNTPWWLPHGPQWWHNLVKGLLQAVATTLDYFNMLIAMTFNVGLFVAVVLGYALGTALFSHIPDNYTAKVNQELAAHREAAKRQALQDLTFAEDGRGVKANNSESNASTDNYISADHPSCCPAPM